MLLLVIFISVVVCTVEIHEFLSVFPLFICLLRPLENLSAVLLDPCDNFSFVGVSFSMTQIRGSCGHIKGTYDNHPSCINCCGCYRFHRCSVSNFWSDATWALVSKRRLYSDRPMGKKEAKEKKPRKSASRISSSSRRVLNGLNRQTRRGLLLKVQMMMSHQLCLGHHRGMSACAGTPKFPSIAHTEHRVRRLRRGVGRPNVPPPPDP